MRGVAISLVFFCFIRLGCSQDQKINVEYIRDLFSPKLQKLGEIFNVKSNKGYKCERRSKDIFTTGREYEYEYVCIFDVECGENFFKYEYIYYIRSDRIIEQYGKLLTPFGQSENSCYRR